MLNDLYAIERAFAANGDPVGAVHPDVKEMAKGPAFRLRLDAQARLAGVELITDAGRGAVWTLRDGQHNGFPGLKTKAGLIDIDSAERARHDETWKKHKAAPERRAELKRLVEVATPATGVWPEPGHRKRIAERLADLSALTATPNTASVPAVFARFLDAANASPSLLAQLAAQLAEALDVRGDEWLEPIRDAFLGAAPLVIDVALGEFPRDASDPRQIPAVSAALSGDPGASGATGLCALSGETTALHRGNYPQPNLPGLGQSYLYSRNADIPALKRYARIAETSFSIGGDLVKRLGGVVGKLTQAPKRGRTWELIPAEAGDKSDLVLASLAVLPELLDGDGEELSSAAEAAQQGSAFFTQLGGGANARPGSAPDVSLLVLRTVDPANRKAIYSRRLRPERVEAAALHWRRAMDNLPQTLGFSMPRKGQKVPVFTRPRHQPPLTLTELTRALFANAGARRVEIVGLSAAEAMALFFDDGDARGRAKRTLRAFAKRYAAMLIRLASAAREGADRLRDVDSRLELRRYALRALSWFGALLFLMGRERETYMDGFAYRLGQFLSGADLLHVGYCADRRGGDVPPVLAGASLMTRAAGDPMRALAVLSQRIKPYRDWFGHARLGALKQRIQQLDADKKPGLAIAIRTALTRAQQMQDASRDLHEKLLAFESAGAKTDDAFKAELLLGYLAGYPKVGKRDAQDDPDNEGQGDES